MDEEGGQPSRWQQSLSPSRCVIDSLMSCGARRRERVMPNRVFWPPREGTRMPGRWVLLLAAAVVFAPGWAGGAPLSLNASSSDLAARVLAPTFEEASTDRTAKKKASTKEADRQKAWSSWDSHASLVADARRLQPPPLALLATVIGMAAVATLRPRVTRAQRAPPHPVL